MMSTRFLPLREGDTAHWALLTCPYHAAGDVALKREGAFTEVRCRECAREAEAVPALGPAIPPGRVRPMGGAGWTTGA
jgi:hypothetical protein